jgi:hypothetical protein
MTKFFFYVALVSLLYACEEIPDSLMESNQESEPSPNQQAFERQVIRGDLTGAIDSLVLAPSGTSPDCLSCSSEIELEAPSSISPPPSEECLGASFQNSSTVYIGDSHSAVFGQSSLARSLSQSAESCPGAEFNLYAACGSSPRSWLSEGTVSSSCGTLHRGNLTNRTGQALPNLATISQQNQPDQVIINLGDNMFSWRRNNGKLTASLNSNRTATEVQRLINALPERSQCYWVGPTYHSVGSVYSKPNEVVDQFYSVLGQAIGDRCRIVDSRPFFTTTRPNDGLHLVPSESQSWGEQIVSTIQSFEGQL